jgi:hypothetical protein
VSFDLGSMIQLRAIASQASSNQSVFAMLRASKRYARVCRWVMPQRMRKKDLISRNQYVLLGDPINFIQSHACLKT